MPQTLTIDASGMTGKSFNQNTYFEEFFEGLTYDDNTFYGGTPDSAFGGTYYVNGSEVVNRYTDGTDPVEQALIIEGTEIAYDFIHHGAQFGHGISGEVSGLVFGRWMDGTTSGTEGTGDAGRVSGFNENVVIDGLDVSAAPGTGNEPGDNPVNALYSAAQDMDASVFTALFEDYGSVWAVGPFPSARATTSAGCGCRPRNSSIMALRTPGRSPDTEAHVDESAAMSSVSPKRHKSIVRNSSGRR